MCAFCRGIGSTIGLQLDAVATPQLLQLGQPTRVLATVVLATIKPPASAP